MKLYVKEFNALSLMELYNILRLRNEVFVVEQNSVYLDTDGIDMHALHVFYADDDNIRAYSRVYEDGTSGDVKIGRIVVAHKGTGMGAKVVKDAISVATSRFNCRRINIHAQVYAIGFYEKQGFSAYGNEFMEDGIPHVMMEIVF